MAYRNFLQAATPKIWIGALRLTAANELCPGVTAGKDTHDPHTGYNKAYFYNMLGVDGQTVLHLQSVLVCGHNA
jgi:hypothetical protein